MTRYNSGYYNDSYYQPDDDELTEEELEELELALDETDFIDEDEWYEDWKYIYYRAIDIYIYLL